MNRIYIFTGKGGVGKTSVAAAHAIKSAKDGYKTLLVSTDMAHNLGDLFDMHIGKEPISIIENLSVYEIDPTYIIENDFTDIMKCMNNMLPESVDNSMEDFGILPGTEELFSLLKINEIYNENIYDRIIVDCAPTGETLSLLKFPELLSWYMEKLFPLGKIGVKVLAPISKQFFKIELPNKSAMNDIERLYLKLSQLQELLKNRETTSIRLVTMPEKMVVEETKRNYMYMNLYNFNVDGIYINRILPKDMNNSFFDEWLNIQSKYIKELKEIFVGIPTYNIPWYDEELIGINGVNRICNDVLNDNKVFDFVEITKREVYEKNENGYLLSVFIPLAKKSDLDLYQSEMDVVIKLNNFKRNIPLPNILRNYLITSAKLEEGILKIQFERGE
ncbi:ArsA family ATPase [Terrisporobacter vanillatitrophus]|uniref:ArsA family ATPase n=1 Tax=Terrisporobacter vanillatitrophus TaxID=3058402 RepID=UPI0033670E4C